MSVDPTKLAALLALDARNRPAVCAYWKVNWDQHDSGQSNYYSDAIYNQMSPFGGIGVGIEAKLLNNPLLSTFEISPDLRTQTIPLIFDDIDRGITAKFQTFKSGVRCELYFYWPDVNLTALMWKGQLQAPPISGWKTFQATATNGFKSRELFLPNRGKRRECGRRVFGAKMPDADARASALCDYNPATGIGVYKTGTTPFDDCPALTINDCILRFGHGLTWGGFNTDPSAVVFTSQGNNYLAISKGNNSALRIPVRVIAGSKYVRGMQLLLWRRNGTGNNSFVSTLWEIGEGPIESVTNFKVNELIITSNQLNIRLGDRRQLRTNYAPDVSNFHMTAHVYAVYGPVNPLTVTPANLAAEGNVRGFKEVCVYSSATPVTKTRTWSDNRAWWLLEMYKNQKFGFGYSESEFQIADWISAAVWTDKTVTATYAFDDAESYPEMSRRASFNAILEGRPSTEQIEDIARSGGLSVPYYEDGKITVGQFRAFTTTELSNAVVFTDTGTNKNILAGAAGDGHLIDVSFIPDDRIYNEIEVIFEEASNYDNARPITMDDPDQKLRAGQVQGLDHFLSVPRRYSGFGINNLAEAKRFARRMLWFGEFDSGGTQNNGKVFVTCPMEWALGLKKYGPMKVNSQVLNGYTIGTVTGGVNLVETLSTFRVLNIENIGGGRAKITGQAYNHTAYTYFEVESVSTPGAAYALVTQAGTEFVRGQYGYIGEINGRWAGANDAVTCAWGGSTWEFTDTVDGTLYYHSSNNVTFPWLATTWIADNGEFPNPRVTSGAVPAVYEPPGEVTIDPPTYDTASGVLSVTIN